VGALGAEAGGLHDTKRSIDDIGGQRKCMGSGGRLQRSLVSYGEVGGGLGIGVGGGGGDPTTGDVGGEEPWEGIGGGEEEGPGGDTVGVGGRFEGEGEGEDG